jgi:hypothetical protein
LQDDCRVNIYLPNKVLFPYLKVTECTAVVGKFNMVVGMDIVTLEDYFKKNLNKKIILVNY